MAFADEHGTAPQDFVASDAFGDGFVVAGDEVVFDDVLHLGEPELAERGEDAAFFRDRRRQHDVEGAEPVAGDEEQGVAEVEDFTDFAAFGVEPGRFGMDSIVRVPQPTLRIAAPTIKTEVAAA